MCFCCFFFLILATLAARWWSQPVRLPWNVTFETSGRIIPDGCGQSFLLCGNTSLTLMLQRPFLTKVFPAVALAAAQRHRKRQTHCFHMLCANGGNSQRSGEQSSTWRRKLNITYELSNALKKINDPSLLMCSQTQMSWWFSGACSIIMAAREGWRMQSEGGYSVLTTPTRSHNDGFQH